MPHDHKRPCLSCTAKSLMAQFHVQHGYSTMEILSHMADVLADFTAIAAVEGHEAQAQAVVTDLLQASLTEAFAHEAQRRAEDAPGPKEPTTNDIGHA